MLVDVSYLTTKVDWDKLRVFNYVAWSGSLTKAAEKMMISQSAISRQISSLEEIMECKLFRRHPRGLLLTEQGDILFATTQEIFGKISNTLSVLRHTKNIPSGHLKVSTTSSFAYYWLMPRIKAFMQLYPALHVSHFIADDEQSLSKPDIDIILKPYPTQQLRMVQRPILKCPRSVYASRGYLENHTKLENINDVEHHNIVTYSREGANSEENLYVLIGAQSDSVPSPFLNFDSHVGVLKAVETGMGIGIVFDYIAAQKPDLVKVVPDLQIPPIEHYLIYPEELRHTKKIVAFKDFLLEELIAEDKVIY